MNSGGGASASATATAYSGEGVSGAYNSDDDSGGKAFLLQARTGTRPVTGTYKKSSLYVSPSVSLQTIQYDSDASSLSSSEDEDDDDENMASAHATTSTPCRRVRG